MTTIKHHGCNTTGTGEKSEEVITQTGVKRAEAVAMTWTKQSLYIAYAGFVIVLLTSSYTYSELTPKNPMFEQLQNISYGILYLTRYPGY